MVSYYVFVNGKVGFRQSCSFISRQRRHKFSAIIKSDNDLEAIDDFYESVVFRLDRADQLFHLRRQFVLDSMELDTVSRNEVFSSYGPKNQIFGLMDVLKKKIAIEGNLKTDDIVFRFLFDEITEEFDEMLQGEDRKKYLRRAFSGYIDYVVLPPSQG